ncbi:UDP-glycosyltransferase 85A2, partial [Bienertia sinuspersici]
MLQLAKLLHSQGFHITFVHTEFNYNHLPPNLSVRDYIRRDAPVDDPDATQDIPSHCISTEYKSIQPFKELIVRLNESSDVPQVSCIVADVAMCFTLDVANELGIPEVLECTTSPC